MVDQPGSIFKTTRWRSLAVKLGALGRDAVAVAFGEHLVEVDPADHTEVQRTDGKRYGDARVVERNLKSLDRFALSLQVVALASIGDPESELEVDQTAAKLRVVEIHRTLAVHEVETVE